MKKIKKLSIAVVVLVICLLLGVTVWSADGNKVQIEAVANKASFCTQDYAQTVTITLKASAAIDVFSLQARLQLPDGWSASVTGLDGIFEYNAESGMIVWVADLDDALNVTATELAKIEVTIPKGASVNDHIVSLTGIEVVKLLVNDGELGYQYWAENTNLCVNVAINNHVHPCRAT